MRTKEGRKCESNQGALAQDDASSTFAARFGSRVCVLAVFSAAARFLRAIQPVGRKLLNCHTVLEQHVQFRAVAVRRSDLLERDSDRRRLSPIQRKCRHSLVQHNWAASGGLHLVFQNRRSTAVCGHVSAASFRWFGSLCRCANWSRVAQRYSSVCFASERPPFLRRPFQDSTSQWTVQHFVVWRGV